MRGAVCEDAVVELVDDLTLGGLEPTEVRVDVGWCGLCETDLHLVHGALPFPQPMVCGHEVVGTVVEVGAEAIGTGVVAVGARVLVTCTAPCRRCWYCRRAEPHLCARSKRWATGTRADGSTPLSHRGRPVHIGVGVGGFAEAVVVDVASVVALPDDVPGPLAAVLGCAVLTGTGAVRSLPSVEGATVVVVGLGGVGLSAVFAARALGAASVTGVDVRADRRSAAAPFLDVVLDAEDALDEVWSLTEDRGADLVVDAVGSPERSIPLAFACTRPGGHLVVAGVPPAGASLVLPAAALVSEERHIHGCFVGSADPARDVPALLDWWRDGKLPLEQLVTSVAPFESLPELLGGAITPAGVRTVVAIGATGG